MELEGRLVRLDNGVCVRACITGSRGRSIEITEKSVRGPQIHSGLLILL